MMDFFFRFFWKMQMKKKSWLSENNLINFHRSVFVRVSIVANESDSNAAEFLFYCVLHCVLFSSIFVRIEFD